MKSILQTLTIVLLALSLNAQTYINQAATGNNDGSSWQDAYTNPQDAFSNAITNDEIWIAAGTYKPQVNALPDSNWYYIDRALTIYGGFAGTETALDQRDWEANPTIWDADILGDDTPNDFNNNRDDNAFHLLVAEIVGGALTLDGLTITSANGLTEEIPTNTINLEPYVGALYLRGSGIIRNCIFKQSNANLGGVFAIRNSTTTQNILTLENCNFTDNRGTFTAGVLLQGFNNGIINNCHFENNIGVRGGGLYTFAVDNVSTTNSSFLDNFAEDWGGGMVVGNSNLNLSDCIFQNNEVPGSTIGAGIFIFQNSGNIITNPTLNITNCDFLENIAGAGGGICLNNFYPGSTINVDGCYFFGNESNFATNNGGAAIVFQNFQDNFGGGIPDLSATITNSSFEENESYAGGAAFFYSASATFNLEISNSEFTNNFAETEGGGIFSNGSNSQVKSTINNTTFYNNEATDGSVIGNIGDTETTLTNILAHNNLGDVAIYNTGKMDLINCTLVDNNAGVFNLGNNSTMSLQNTILANTGLDNLGSENNITSYGGNLSNDQSLLNVLQGFDNYPDFTEVSPLLDSDFIPLSNSPCIDAGNPSNINVTTDLAGDNRIQGSQIDIGAYESGFDVGLNSVHENTIRVFPNPFVKELHLSDIEGIQEIRLLDVTGREIERFAPNTELVITKELQVGIYFLEMDYGSYREVANLERL